MSNITNQLRHRLKLLDQWFDIPQWQKSVQTAQLLRPDASDYEKAWMKFNTADRKALFALVCYYAEECQMAHMAARECLTDCDEFFFGNWRNIYTTKDKSATAAWWKREFVWMQIFEASLLWGSALGEWEFLKKVGVFPEPDSCISDGYVAQDRDFYVAVASFVRSTPRFELEGCLERAAAGPKKSCQLGVAVMRTCIARDSSAFQNALDAFLKHYKKSEFPKKDMTKKVSVEGTFFVHWAEKERIVFDVPARYNDHIVRLDI